MKLEKFSMAALADKLGALGGTGKLSEREWRIRCRLNWHHKARSTIRHMLYGERRPYVNEARQIEAAHLKHCAEKIEANSNDNARLYQSMRTALAAMEATDPEFYREQAEALRQILFRPGDLGGGEGKEDRP